MFKRLRNYFFTGLIIILPAILTIIILRFMVLKLNFFLLEPVVRFFPALKFNPYYEYAAKVLAFILAVFSIILVGLAARSIIIRNTFQWFEKKLIRLPMVDKIYTVAKQLSNAFLGSGKKFFDKVVLVEYPRKGIYSVGFVVARTGAEIAKEIGVKLSYNVFIPTSPNPTSGVFLIVPEEQLIFLEMRIEEAMKLIISIGKVSL